MIEIVVRDLQITATPLIYQKEFNDYNLKIGDNILSQHWGQKTLLSSFLGDGNSFRYFVHYFYRIGVDLTHEHTRSILLFQKS